MRAGEKYVSRPLQPGGEQAETRFTVLSTADGRTLIEAEPVTGRTHQIRVHAAEHGLPILGDVLYGLGEALCLDRNLAPELALTKADALSVARRQSGAALSAGWRREAVGAELEQIAAGTSSVRLQVMPDALAVTLEETH